MTAEYFKRTEIHEACEVAESILSSSVVSEVKIELLGSGSIVKIKAYPDEESCRKLNKIFYDKGWVNDLSTLANK